VTIGATLLMGGSAQAACTCTVDSLADPTEGGHTTLRDALTSAELPANEDSTITFASGLSGTITLGSQLPTISQGTTIQGPGAGQLTISGNDASRILYVTAPIGGFEVTVSGLTLARGYSSSEGGAIYSYNGNLTISDAVISGNTADGSGGAVFAYSNYGRLSVRDSTLSGNSSDAGGGAIYDVGTPLTIQGSTFNGNQSADRGGAIGMDSPHLPSTIENSTLTGNHTTGGRGGAIYSYSAQYGLTLSDTTVADNITAIAGGGVFAHGAFGGTPVVLHNSIVAGNTAPSAADLGGAFDSAFSLIQDGSAATVSEIVPGSDVVGQPALLGPLADNGGPTQTMLPAASSRAIDQGAAFGAATDQRTRTRPFEFAEVPNSTAAGADGSDIGAVELQPSDIPSNAFTVGKLKGRRLKLTLASEGLVRITDTAASSSSARAFAAKAKALLKPVALRGGPGPATAILALTKRAKSKLRRVGKLKLRAAITFTPTGGLPASKAAKLKLRTKK
jgi:Chlamydia polymorphic membrane protein (Chlamydia_PMP) repeat